jgi:hypothetical protein
MRPSVRANRGPPRAVEKRAAPRRVLRNFCTDGRNPAQMFRAVGAAHAQKFRAGGGRGA